MGADRAVLVSDPALEGADLLGTAKALAGALGRESAELVLFGQQSADGGGACLWAAVAERLQSPVVSQVSELGVDGGALTGKRQTEYGYDTIRAPLPAVVAVADSINTPRYPSLKGIMGAKKKPQETVGGRRCRRREQRRRPSSRSTRRPPRGESQKIDGRRLGRREDPRVPRREEIGLMAKTLVFLEHHEGAIAKGSLGVLAKAAQVGGEVAGVVVGSGVRELAESAGAFGAATVWVADDERSRRRSRSPASTCSPSSFATRASTRCCSRSPCSPPTSRRVSPRGSTRASTGASSISTARPGKAPQLSDTVFVDVGWSSDIKLAIFRAGAFDANEVGGTAEVKDAAVELEDFSTRAEMVEQAHAEQQGRRSRTPT